MRPANERRPGDESTEAATMFAGGGISSSIAPTSNIPAQVRRRRAASYRCPVLADGRRDPIDKPRKNYTITVRAIGRNTVELVGCDRAVFAVITTLCAAYQRAPRGGAWLVRQDSVEDLMALLEVRGYCLEATL